MKNKAHRTEVAWLIARSFIRVAVPLALASTAAFFLVEMLPLDLLQTSIGQAVLGSMSSEQIQKLREYWGIGVSTIKRFLSWTGDLIRGDMGVSLLYRQPASHVIGMKLMNSLWLMASAWILPDVVGLGLRIAAGVKKGGMTDKVISAYAFITTSAPAFRLVLVLLMVFAVWLKPLPIGLSVPIGVEASDVTVRDRIVHAISPVVALSITRISDIAMHTREGTIEMMESDYVLFARARGESTGSIVWQYGIRNIILLVTTLQFASVSKILGDSMLVEQVFSYPDLGQAAVTAGLGGDVPLLLGITVTGTTIIFAGNLTANPLYGVLDPRVHRGKK